MASKYLSLGWTSYLSSRLKYPIAYCIFHWIPQRHPKRMPAQPRSLLLTPFPHTEAAPGSSVRERCHPPQPAQARHLRVPAEVSFPCPPASSSSIPMATTLIQASDVSLLDYCCHLITQGSPTPRAQTTTGPRPVRNWAAQPLPIPITA